MKCIPLVLIENGEELNMTMTMKIWEGGEEVIMNKLVEMGMRKLLGAELVIELPLNHKKFANEHHLLPGDIVINAINST
jgi:hypothetical protein